MTDRAPHPGDRLAALAPGPSSGIGRDGEVPDGGAAGDRPDDEALTLRRRALAAAASAYTAAHGHPAEERPAGRTRWLPTRRAALAAGLALAVLGGVVALRGLDGPAVTVPLAPVPTAVVDPGLELLPVATPAPAEVVVHVVGEVVTPGVVRLTAGARVADAVEAAGGPTPGADVTALNLARTVVDGEQIRVPAPGEAVAAADPSAAGATPGPLDLNAATETELDALPGIGPVLAARIVAWREAAGRFTRVGELAEVSGIGPRLLADLEPLVTVG